MSGDGVSLQPTIVQMGTVAQTQAKGQQATHPTTPFSERLEPSQDTKVRRARKPDETTKRQVDPEARRDQERAPGRDGQRAADAGGQEPAPAAEGAAPGGPDDAPVGRLIDTRA